MLYELLESNLTSSRLEVFTTGLEGKNIYEQDLAANALILLGNESRGVSSEFSKMSTHVLCIPEGRKETAMAESLNAGIAAGIVCSEFRRRFPA